MSDDYYGTCARVNPQQYTCLLDNLLFVTRLVWLVYGVLRHFQQYFSYIVAVLLVEKIGVPRENHRPVANH